MEEELKDAIWAIWNKGIDNRQNGSKLLASIIASVMEIGMLARLKPQFLLVAQLAAMEFSKEEALEIVEHIYDMKSKQTN